MLPQPVHDDAALEDILRAIRERCIYARMVKMLSQDALAGIMHLSRPTVTWFESGKQRLTVAYVLQLAKVTGAPLAWLLAEQDFDAWPEAAFARRYDPRIAGGD